MTDTLTRPLTTPRRPSHSTQTVDVLIVGAGISGVGAAYHLKTQSPDLNYVVLEAQDGFGGTWKTHRYPGIRSDSDLYTFGYRFKPWTDAPIASAPEILKYMGEVIEENGLAETIRYGHKVSSASWSSAEAVWSVEAVRLETGETLRFRANFLWMCQGYFRHDEGYTPRWDGMDDYQGRIVHPQTWPEDVDLAGKRVAVIGSGATAATVIPAIAETCERVTMIQRSPTYFIPGRNAIDLADQLRELEVEEAWIHEIVRRRLLKDQDDFTRRCVEEPETVRGELMAAVREIVGPDFDVETHFNPTYRPWRQRIAFVPDGDFFQAIAKGKAGVVTGEIDRFEADGVRMKSGELVQADLVVTATGFHMSVLGDIDFTIDGEPLDPAETVTYRGMMFTGVPNLAWVFGYFRASWTLRADIVSDFICRLLNHMGELGRRKVSVRLRPQDQDMEIRSWIDPEDFNPSYLMRALDRMPKRGVRPEWQHTQDYWSDRTEFPKIDLDGAEFLYE